MLKNVVVSNLVSSSQTTKEWTSVYNGVKRYLTKFLKDKGCTEIKFNKGHFYLSGFYTTSQGKIYYFNIQDFRDYNLDRMLVRTAEHYKDFTGGGNNFISISNFENEINRFV